jgi:hypothetical protein
MSKIRAGTPDTTTVRNWLLRYSLPPSKSEAGHFRPKPKDVLHSDNKRTFQRIHQFYKFQSKARGSSVVNGLAMETGI